MPGFTLRETGFHDVRGIPICVGDLIRVKHFRHYRRREQMWLYFRVAELNGVFVVYRWNVPGTHQCLLKHCWEGLSHCREVCEILDGLPYRNERGEPMMWNERPRKKKEEVSDAACGSPHSRDPLDGYS